MKNLAKDFETAEEAAEHIIEFVSDKFANDSGYEVSTSEEVAELLTTGQAIHTVAGDWQYFEWKWYEREKRGYQEFQENDQRIMIHKDGSYILTENEELALAQGASYVDADEFGMIELSQAEAEGLGLDWD